MSSALEEAQAPPSVTTQDELSTQSGNAPDQEQSEVGNVDKIRDIIFGGQMRDYEKRFKLLETRLIQETVELREDTRKRLAVLEMYVKRELDALSERLQTEQRSREEAIQGVLKSQSEANQLLESKLAQSDANHARTERDLRAQILEQSNMLRDEIRQKHEDITSALGREVAGLTEAKTSRSDLASMFGDLALRLNGDLTGQSKD
jgi:hypothetical protein